jgi:hypothetical protein
MPEWLTYLIVFLAGVIVGRLGRSADSGPRMPVPPPRPLTPKAASQIRQLLSQGKKIDAIKVYRQTTGSGLEDAKEGVEAIQDRTG